MGSVAGALLNSESCATVGPLPTKMRPWWPSEDQDTCEPGPPDRSAEVGAGCFGSNSSLTFENVLFITLIAPRTTTPLRTAMKTASTVMSVTTNETRGGATRLS